MKTPQQGRLGPDGVIRTADQEAKLNKLFTATFSSESGREVLRHLRHITIESVSGPNIGSNELFHREGQRYIIGLIEQRVGRGHNV
jgi:hypothetical protein